MLEQKDINKLIDTLSKNFPGIRVIIQFGSSSSGDYNKEISDIDLAIITKLKNMEKQIKNFIFKSYSPFKIQTHIFSIISFIKRLKQADPLTLSILYTGKPLYGKEYFYKIKKRNFKANSSTIRRCVLNSFAALSLAISDLTHGMLFDSVNSIYHAARSSIWGVLFNTHITPRNKNIFELIKDKRILDLYKKIIHFRNNIPYYKENLDLPTKIYEKGNINQFTQLLEDATKIIKINYKKIFKKNFISLFELFEILNRKYGIPEFYSVFLSVNWKSEKPIYLTTLSFNNKMVLLNVNTTNGKIKEIKEKVI